MSIQKIDPPLYRITADGGAFANGAMHRKGAVIPNDNWPTQAFEAMNDTAHRIVTYHRRRQAWMGFPRSPWNAELGTYYLPGLLMSFTGPRVHSLVSPKGSEIRGLVGDDEVDRGLPAMPEYEMLADHRVGHRNLKKGDRFAFIGWPVLELFEAVNEPAKQVVRYWHEYHAHPKLPIGGPWCWARGLYLPELQKPRPTKAYPDGSYRPLDTDKYADAIAGEIEGITGKRPGAPGSVPPTYPSGVTTRVR